MVPVVVSVCLCAQVAGGEVVIGESEGWEGM